MSGGRISGRPNQRRAGELEAALAAFAALEERRGPTMRELAAALALGSESVAFDRIRALEAHGWVERIPNARTDAATRGYRLTAAGMAALPVDRKESA